MVYRWLLRCYGALPFTVRTSLVRIVKPKYTVGTIPFVVRRDGRVLLVRHSYRKDWATPGGFVNRRERAEDAAVREAREEVGLDVTIVAGPLVALDPVGQRVEVVFLAEALDDAACDAAAPRSPEVVEARWFDVGSLPHLQDEARSGWGALLDAARSSAEIARRLPVDRLVDPTRPAA